MALKDVNIDVVGAGVGGLASALALRRRGARVRVLEQAAELREIGAGLQISANGMAVLRALGVFATDTGRPGLRSEGTIIRDFRSGRQVTIMPPPSAGPTFYFHRADLIELLHNAAVQAGVDLVCGQEVLSCRADHGQSYLQTADGGSYQSDLVVAADGGRSSLRNSLSAFGKPDFTGQVAWRATIDRAQTENGTTAVLTMGPGRHIVTYPIRDGCQTNIVAVEERSDWRREGWRHEGDPDDLKRRFSGFGGEVAEQLASVQAVNIWALFLHPVAPKWQDGRLVLVGDAAHPTLPFMAQGACLALEDAWVLAQCLDQSDGRSQALAEYEIARKYRARRVVAAAAANARNFHYKSPMRELVQLGLFAFGSRIARRYEWIYSHDVTR